MKTKPKTELRKTPELYRAKLNCEVARDALNGKSDYLLISEVGRIMHALFCLSYAIEEIAKHMQKEKQ